MNRLRRSVVGTDAWSATTAAVLLTVAVLEWPAALAAGAGSSQALPDKPPGPYFHLSSSAHRGTPSFTLGQPLVAATYFYWYDVHSNSHIRDADGSDALTTHPYDMESLSYREPAWHKAQLLDMIDADIDVLLAVYWGVPGQYDGWSFAGLPALVRAHDELKAHGREVPAIGLFYDTSILRWNRFGPGGRNYHVDLSTEFGKRWFYTAARDFFSMIPPDKWARIDGKPVIFLYTAAFAKKQDPQQLAYLRRCFKRDFGVEPFIVKSVDWRGSAEAIYSWGGAVNGPLIFDHVACLGPGYDHSAVPGRAPLVVDRRDGKTYIDRWVRLLQLHPEHRPWLVHVETWNEWHEGTDIAHSREFGRVYINLTRLFSDLWHAKTHLRLSDSYLSLRSLSWRPGEPNGITVRASGGDGCWESVTIGDVEAIVAVANPHSQSSRYLYFDIDDAFATTLYRKAVQVLVTYRDSDCGAFCIEYDNVDQTVGPREGAFRPTEAVAIKDTGAWKTAVFALPDCRFMNRCNNADFRITISGGQLALAVSRVELRKIERAEP